MKVSSHPDLIVRLVAVVYFYDRNTGDVAWSDTLDKSK